MLYINKRSRVFYKLFITSTDPVGEDSDSMLKKANRFEWNLLNFQTRTFTNGPIFIKHFVCTGLTSQNHRMNFGQNQDKQTTAGFPSNCTANFDKIFWNSIKEYEHLCAFPSTIIVQILGVSLLR